jgi:hypothetical protein
MYKDILSYKGQKECGLVLACFFSSQDVLLIHSAVIFDNYKCGWRGK